MNYLPYFTLAIGLFLLARVLAALFRGSYRRFPILFAYVLSLFLMLMMEGVAVLTTGGFSNRWPRLYWFNELVRQSGVYAVILSLLIEAVRAQSDRGRRQANLLAVAAILYWVGSMYFCYDERLNRWMTLVIRNLTFGSALLIFVLWAKLIASPKRDPSVLLISAALGLEMAATAAGHSLRAISKQMVPVGGYLTVVGSLLCYHLLWKALSRYPKPAPLESAAKLEYTGRNE